MTSNRIHVRYTKWDGSLHWHFDAQLVARDSCGSWLLVEPGTPYRRGSEPPRVDEHGFVVLIPDGGWWTAYFNAVPRPRHGHLIYVDINTAPRWEGNTVHLVDLDLDVVMDCTGSVAIVDQDEFETHQRQFSYPADVIERTRHAAAAIYRRMTSGEEPFGRTGPANVAQHLSWTTGTVVSGHGAASGSGGDPRFPEGTLAHQFPHFSKAGVPLDGLTRATINVDLAFRFVPQEPKHRIANLEWLEGYPAENFEFFDARIAHGNTVHPALVYRPDPATKPEFAQPDNVVELLTRQLADIPPGTPTSVWIDPRQGHFVV